MSIANRLTYLESIIDEFDKLWPNNRTINIVCHGHSVPSGYFRTPFVDTFNSYPHLMHKLIKERFPFAVINVIVTAIGGERSDTGSDRFNKDVLNHNPDIVTIDYGLNDRRIDIDIALKSHEAMISSALEHNVKVILLTPSWDKSYFTKDKNWELLLKQTKQIAYLADKYEIGLSDSFNEFNKYVEYSGDLCDLLSHGNHPNKKGHELIALELSRWFLAR